MGQENSSSTSSGLLSNEPFIKALGIFVGFSFIGLFWLDTYSWGLWLFLFGAFAGLGITVLLLMDGVDNPNNQQTKVAIMIRYSLLGFILATIVYSGLN